MDITYISTLFLLITDPEVDWHMESKAKFAVGCKLGALTPRNTAGCWETTAGGRRTEWTTCRNVLCSQLSVFGVFALFLPKFVHVLMLLFFGFCSRFYSRCHFHMSLRLL